MKKLFILFLFSTFLFTSCSTKEEKKEDSEKTPFYIETEKLGNFDNKYKLQKTSKIASIGEVYLTSEVFGKLGDIKVKEGDKVSKGQVLVNLKDQSGNINIAYKQAKLNLSQAKNSYDSSKIGLDKAVFDAKLNLEKLELNYETLKKNTEETLKQAKDSLESTSFDKADSKSYLDLQKLDETIKKLEFDYDRSLSGDEETLKSFFTNLEKESDNLKNLTSDIFDFGDKLFFITDLYSENTSFNTYFGANDISQKNETKILLQNLYNFKEDELKNLKIETIKDLDKYSKIIKKGYKLNINFLQSVQDTVNNSIPSLGSLSEMEINGYNQTINSLQAQMQGSNTAFTALKNNINTFLNTYKDKQESLKKQIEITKKDREIMKKALESGKLNAEVGYNKTLISSDDALKNMEIAIKNAKNLLYTAEKNRDVTLKTLRNNIVGAEIALEKANISYSKLNLTSPINGIVSEIFVDLGQSYQPGTKFVKIVSDSENELFVYLPIEELEKVNIGDEVLVNYRGDSFSGSVFSKSNLADKNLNYKVKISLPEKLSFIGGVADVSFNFETSKKLLPINAVDIISSEKKLGEIVVFSGGTLETKTIKLGKTFGDRIEFETDLKQEVIIVLNDVSNFDNDKFYLEKK